MTEPVAPRIASVADVERRSANAVLIDVRLAEEFACGHLPGAVNNCVFEVAFLGRMEAIAPDRAAVIVIYGAGSTSLESRAAAAKLVRAGYADIRDFQGGIAEWRASGRPIESRKDAPSAPSAADGSYRADLERSRVEWLGRNLLNKHWGTVALQSGRIEMRHGALVGGEFVLDMTTLVCTDLAGSPMHDVLIAHLASDDFFDVERFPEARFAITRAVFDPGQDPGGQNLAITGELTLAGVTAPVEFAASAGVDDRGKPAAQATLSLDRTLWQVIYGSGRFFQRLGGHLVNDRIELQIRIVAV